jgi:DNA (cytosine-5)-methyltransferase 1
MDTTEIKILNLYACLGGNRYKWDEIANVKVTAVELDPELARLYQERFPNDIVIVADAHQYLLDHYKEYDFIWSSPPCPTHSRLVISNKTRMKLQYPDMKLYQEIIFLKNFFDGKYCVENVISYYDPLIAPKKRDRHYYWTNFNLPNKISNRELKTEIGRARDNKTHLLNMCKLHNYDFTKYKGDQNIVKVANNLVDYEAGKTILQTAIMSLNQNNIYNGTLFETK